MSRSYSIALFFVVTTMARFAEAKAPQFEVRVEVMDGSAAPVVSTFRAEEGLQGTSTFAAGLRAVEVKATIHRPLKNSGCRPVALTLREKRMDSFGLERWRETSTTSPACGTNRILVEPDQVTRITISLRSVSKRRR